MLTGQSSADNPQDFCNRMRARARQGRYRDDTADWTVSGYVITTSLIGRIYNSRITLATYAQTTKQDGMATTDQRAPQRLGPLIPWLGPTR